MRIGLSFSRCIRDIVDEKVSINDVLVIIARTKVDPNDDTHWTNVWEGYTTRSGFSAPEWIDYLDREDEFRRIARDLYNEGKIHQPRMFGAYPSRLSYYWLETILPIEELNQKPGLKDAWERFQVLAELSSIDVAHSD